MAAFVTVTGLRKKFGNEWAVDDVGFEVEEGKLLVLLGPSGCGKTTTLRCVGGLEQPDGGKIVIDGEVVTDADGGRFLLPEARGMGMVPQSYAIWPHMTVFENVAFPLKMQRLGRSEVARRVQQALDVVRLEEFGGRNATDLSGGQQQRVALARAIVGTPKVLLFDEPLSNLDAKLREEMRDLLKDIQREINITAIYVTHDQAEAMALGEELIVMNAGKVEQRGSARSLYSEPATQFVANFIGVASFFRGTVVAGASGGEDSALVRLDQDGDEPRLLRVRPGNSSMGEAVVVLVRPEWVTVHGNDFTSEENLIGGTISKSQFLGNHTEVLAETAFAPVRIWADGAADFEEGTTVKLRIAGEKCVALSAEHA